MLVRVLDVKDPLHAWLSLGDEPGVAPPGIERVRALLNTDDRYNGVDRLAVGAPPEIVALRGALRAYLVDGDATAVDRLAEAHPVVVAFAADGSRLQAPGGDVVAGMLAEVHEAHRTGEWQRLKACGNPGCQWVFYDSSRNRSGRWCAMSECGDVMKARAYRARTRRP
jgi:hypothetical protein